MKQFVSIVQKLIDDYREINRAELFAAVSHRKMPHCLVVEDEPHDIELTEYALKRLGVTWEVAETGDRAIQLLNQSRDPLHPDFDIIFLDLVLRGSAAQGIQVLEYVRKHFPSVHVVLVTGHVDAGILHLVAKHKGQGAYLGIVTKPLNIADATEIFKKHRLPTTAHYEI